MSEKHEICIGMLFDNFAKLFAASSSGLCGVALLVQFLQGVLLSQAVIPSVLYHGQIWLNLEPQYFSVLEKLNIISP